MTSARIFILLPVDVVVCHHTFFCYWQGIINRLRRWGDVLLPRPAEKMQLHQCCRGGDVVSARLPASRRSGEPIEPSQTGIRCLYGAGETSMLMKSYSVHFRVSQHFDFPAEEAYKWCTDYDSGDIGLAGDRGSRAVRRINEDTLVLTDTYFTDKGKVARKKLVRLYPEIHS